MSVEIRLNKQQEFVCDWGRFDNPEADPRRGLSHLVITTLDYFQGLLTEGPKLCRGGGVAGAYRDGERQFQYLDHNGQRTTWELFDAHFWDGKGPDDILVGRWPD